MQFDSEYPQDAARERLAATLLAERERGGPALVSVAAPLAPLETFLAAGAGEDAFLWHASEGAAAFAGLGVALRFPLGAGGTLGRLVDDSVAALRDVARVACGPSGLEVPPRLFGGAPFAPPAAIWSGLGAAELVLPRFTYTRSGDEAVLGIALDGSEGREGLLGYDRVLETAYALLDALELHAGGRTGSIHVRPVTASFPDAYGPDPSAWAARVASAREAIAEAEVERVFLGQLHEVRGEIAAWDALEVLARLAVEVHDATRFAMRRGPTSLVGYATETLLRRRGRAVVVETRAGATPGAEPSLGAFVPTRRERRRREGVVTDLAGALARVGVDLVDEADAIPRRARSSVTWVATAAALVPAGAPPGGLVEAVHPSPGVTGHPRDAAETFLRGVDDASRGWLGGTFGWFDAAGDCELVAVDRGAVLGRGSAHAFAGASIVSDSDASAEGVEIHGKLRALLRALGVQTTTT